ncbi:hypothetical protein BN126380116 [Stenotrophomonas thermophila]|nr:hypothetical protein BN126380116 [Stenotrophomonas maltophilia]
MRRGLLRKQRVPTYLLSPAPLARPPLTEGGLSTRRGAKRRALPGVFVLLARRRYFPRSREIIW